MKSPNGKPKGAGPGAKGGFKGPGTRSDKPFNTRTYRRPANGTPTEGFDAPPPSDGAPRHYKPAGDGPKRYRSAGDGPKRPFSASDRPKRTYPTADRRPASPVAAPAQTWPKIEAPEVNRSPISAPKTPDLVELTLSIPASLLRQLENRARDIGVEVKPLVQVWLADKLR